jgi:hypothetical protein
MQTEAHMGTPTKGHKSVFVAARIASSEKRKGSNFSAARAKYPAYGG